MVSPNAKEVFGVFDLVGQYQNSAFNGLLSAIDVVSQKQVVGFRREAPVLENSEQIVVLTMYVPYNFDGGGEFQEHGLGHQNVSGSQKNHFDLGF